ncbi:unnamed protein product [Brassica oleracea var. botrytis]
MATEVESPGRLCTVSLSKKKPPSYLGKDAHNNRYHSPRIILVFAALARVTDKSNTFSSGFSIPVMTRILDFTDKLTQKITEAAVEFIVVSQHFSNTDHDEDDSQSSNSQTSVTPSMRDRHFTR